MRVFFYLPHFQTIKQKVFLFLVHLDQLINVNIDFAFLLKLLVDICSNQLFLQNQILIVQAVWHYLELIKLQLKHKVFVSVILNFVSPAAEEITPSSD